MFDTYKTIKLVPNLSNKRILSIYSLGLPLLEKKTLLCFLLQYNLSDSSQCSIYKPPSIKQYDKISLYFFLKLVFLTTSFNIISLRI